MLAAMGINVVYTCNPGGSPVTITAIRKIRQRQEVGAYPQWEEISIGPAALPTYPTKGDFVTLDSGLAYIVNSVRQPDPNGLITLTLNQRAGQPAGTYTPLPSGSTGTGATTTNTSSSVRIPNGSADGQTLVWSAAQNAWTLASYADGETPGGAVDGTNVVFTLANAPSPQASLVLTRNGMDQKIGGDIQLLGNQVTFFAASTPQPGDVLLASYRY